MSNDIEQARAARMKKLEGADGEKCVEIASDLVEAVDPEGRIDIEAIALMIAAIALCDAFDIGRDTQLDIFANLLKKLEYPAAVLK